MKIVFLRESEIKDLNPDAIETQGFGATETCFITLANQLSQDNEVKVICPCLAQKFYGSVEYIPLTNYSTVKRLLERFKPHILIVVANPTVLFHHVVKGQRCVFWQHNHPLEMNKFPIKNLLEKSIPIVFPSIEAQLFAKNFYRNEKIYGIYNGIRDCFYESESLTKIKNQIVYSGALVKTKGIYELLKAASKLPEFQFKVCGSFDMHTGKTDEEFKKQCLDITSKNVEYLGALKKNDLKKLLEESELCIANPLVGNKEVFCVSAFEAVAIGTPILVGGNSIIDPLVCHGGITYIRDLDIAIKAIMGDENRRSLLSKNGKEFARQFKWNLIAQEWQKFLENICTTE